MKKHLFLKSLLVAIGLLVTSLTTQVWAYGIYINFQGWWANDYASGERAFVMHKNENDDNWTWHATTVLGENWYYYEIPSYAGKFHIGRGNGADGETTDTHIHNKCENVDNGAGIYTKNGNEALAHSTTYTAGWQNADPSNNRWVTVYKDGGASTKATSVDAGYADAVVAGNTVSLNLDQFGAWLWKTRTGESTYTGGIGKLHLNYRLGKDGGSTGDWHDTYTTVVSSENKSSDGKTWFQCWKWDDDLDILANLTTKANLNSGVYYIEYYWSAEVNRATGHANYPEMIYFNRSGSNYYIKFTIPQPEVTISGHPLVGFESMVTAEKVSSKLIEGQTVQYKFERYNGSSWVTAQAYSTSNTFVYTPTNATDKVRVIMKVDQTSEESVAAVQDVYEQYYVYVEDSRDWGAMWLHMSQNGSEYYLDKTFPGEQLLPYDTIDNKTIYRIKLDSYYDHFWLSDGTNTNQTFNTGILINNTESTNVGIYVSDAGNYYKIKTDDNANNCYLAAYPTTLYRIASYDGTTGKTYYSNPLSATEVPGTVSFFANTGNGSSTIKIQTWTGNESNQNGSWATGTTNYKNACSAVSATGNVFTGTLSSSEFSEPAKYEGDYYIHVRADHTRNYLLYGSAKPGTTGTKFIPFEKNVSIFGDTYSHYWVDWFYGGYTGGQSVVATVGNAYNNDLAGTLASDANAPYGRTTEDGANVRYGYDPTTNYFCRAMITGGGSDVKIKADAASTVTIGGNDAYTEARSFSDATNWVYTVAATVKGQSYASTQTTYNGHLQTLLANKKLLGGVDGTPYNVTLSYDLKTNRVIAAWNPEGEDIDYSFDLESNLMVVRTENGRPTVLNVHGSGDIHDIGQIYTVLEITKDNWTKSGGNADRRIVTPGSPGWIDEYYWISLPYECKVSDIFGIPNYGSGDYDNWVLQTYRGDLRAKSGWWAETNAWWYDLERTDTLKANEGYVLRLTNLDGVFPSDAGSKLYLYFPSDKSDLTIAPLGESVTTKLDSMRCHVWRKRPKTELDDSEGENNPIWDRRAIDSNWRVIGSPSFNSTKISSPTFSAADYDTDDDGWIDQEELAAAVEAAGGVYGLKYFYNWIVEEGTPKFSIANAATTEFIATHAHLVQYEGTITWAPYDVDNTPLVGISAAPARKNDNEQTLEQTLRLVLKKDGQEADVAYISRMLFGATTGYDVNMDLSKMTNANSANIYTYGDLYKMAGNCLPDSVTTIQVGVQLATAGNYTFALPDGTNGTGVVLVDNVANTRTNLALTDYTVTLSEGETNERFWLELSPIAQNPTDLEEVQDDEAQTAKARKVMVDGILYIIRDNHIYDATGVILK